MSGGILRFPWTSQPQTPVGADPTLRPRFLITGGPIVRDAVVGSLGANVGGVTPTATRSGIGQKLNGSTGYVSLPTSTAYNITGPLTLIWFGVLNSTAGYNFLMARASGSGGADNPFEFRTDPSGLLTLTRAGPSTFTSLTDVSTVPTGVPVVLAVTHTGAFAPTIKSWFFINGKPSSQAGQSVSAGTGTPTSNTQPMQLGQRGDLFAYAATTMLLCAGFDSVLTDAQIAQISANPWQIFAPIQRTIWVPAAAGGATYTLTAASGSFALTGQDAGLAFNRVLAADTQSYALTGQATGLAFNRTLAADSGSFALTGQDAGLAFNRVLSAANGSYALDGQDVTLTYTPISGATYTLGAASGSFALTGQDTGLAFNRVLTADTQSYSLSGDVAGLAFNRVLTADTVSYALTGQDVALTYTSNGFTYTLTAESGSFEVTGQDASLRHTTTAIAGGGGWLPQTRRKSRKQIYEERVKLGILPPPVIKAAAKVAAVAQTVEEFKEERPKYEEMFLKAIKKTEWLPDYTRAIQAQLAIMEQEEEELLLLL